MATVTATPAVRGKLLRVTTSFVAEIRISSRIFFRDQGAIGPLSVGTLESIGPRILTTIFFEPCPLERSDRRQPLLALYFAICSIAAKYPLASVVSVSLKYFRVVVKELWPIRSIRTMLSILLFASRVA